MQPVCLDTNILIWGIKKQALPEYGHLVDRAAAFLDDLRRKRIPVIIPSIVAAEFMARMPVEEHGQVQVLLQQHFMVAPFDLPASVWYARLWLSKSRSEKKQIKDTLGVTHAELKADHMIVATALARNAGCIYTHDGHLETFAQGHILVRDLPVIPQQGELNLGI